MQVVRCIDPTRDELRALLDNAARQDGTEPPGGWGGLLRHLDHSEGVYYCTDRGPLWGGVQLRVAWWEDSGRRRHWHIGPWESRIGWPMGEEARGGLVAVPAHFGPHEALSWVAPPSSVFVRQRGTASEPVVVCRCGFAGTPESLAWMGQTCGPCHDRELEGLPPLGPPILRCRIGTPCQFAFTPDGRLVTLYSTPSEREFYTRFSLGVWAPPYDGEPISRRQWEEAGSAPYHFAMSCTDTHVAFATQGDLRLLPLDGDAPALSVLSENHWGGPKIAFAGPEREWLVALGRERLRAYPADAEGLGPPAYDLPMPVDGFIPEYPDLAVSPDGRSVYLAGRKGVVRRDARTGAELERYSLRADIQSNSVTATGDGFIASVYTSGQHSSTGWQHSLARWAHAPARRGGWLSWLVGPPATQPAFRRSPVPERHHTELALSPDGRCLAGLSWDPERDEDGSVLDFLDPVTFEPLTTLRPAGALTLRSLTFTPEGDGLLALTSRGLAVYPWRELAGVR